MTTLEEIVSMFPGEMGVYVKDLRTGRSRGLNTDSVFYLASITKVCILVAAVDALDDADPDGELGNSDMNLVLNSRHRMLLTDYRDESHQFRQHHVGTSHSLEELLISMIDRSDGTATDMVVRLVGIDRINRVVDRLGN